MRCDGCSRWTTQRVTDYGDGSRVVNWKAPDGKGACSVLNIETAADFGCTSFDPLAAVPATREASPHVVRTWKNGAPWMHSISGPCPDCRGRGSDTGTCMRCVGTGKVRYYDDGFIGEERTRLHPKEIATAEPLKCRSCAKEIDVRWIACPHCGQKLEPVAETEVVDGLGNAGGAYSDPGREQRAADLHADIEAMNDRSEKIAALRRMTEENGCTPAEAATAKEMADKLEAMA